MNIPVRPNTSHVPRREVKNKLTLMKKLNKRKDIKESLIIKDFSGFEFISKK